MLLSDINCEHFITSAIQQAVSKHLQYNELICLVSEEIMSLKKCDKDY